MATSEKWANRIVGYGIEDADQLLANDKNFRIHPKFQQDALSGVLDQIGWIQNVIVNKRDHEEWGKERGIETVVDGHLRIALAISRGEQVPVTYVNLLPHEENLALATIDPISALAATDRDQLDALLRDVNSDSAAVQQMLSELAAANGILDGLPTIPDPTEKQEPFLKAEVLIEVYCSKAHLAQFQNELDKWGAINGVTVNIS